MNERPAANRLREAMQRADYHELEAITTSICHEAVEVALAERPAVPVNPEEERQRLLDAALADAIEVTSRQRMRLGRRVCSRPDATVTRQIYEALRAMAGADGGCDNDPSFQ